MGPLVCLQRDKSNVTFLEQSLCATVQANDPHDTQINKYYDCHVNNSNGVDDRRAPLKVRVFFLASISAKNESKMNGGPWPKCN